MATIRLDLPVGTLIDRLYEMRALRIEMQRKADDMKVNERAVVARVMELLKKQKATKAGGKVAVASIKESTVPDVKDWTKLYAHIQKTGEFELLHQRIASRAWAERHEANKQVPGVVAVDIEDLSITKSTRS